jgi:hypothetical protein
MKDLWGRALVILAMIVLAIGVTACREHEQGRPMVKEKGVYQGPEDQELGQQRLDDLRMRAAGQKF